jgi:cell division septal protein FtsQ
LPSRLEKRRRNRRVLFISLGAALLVIATMPLWSDLFARLAADQFVGWSNRFRVEQIQIHGNHLVATDQIADLAKVQKGVSLFHVPVAAVRTRIEAHPWIRSAMVQRRLPDTIEITIFEREPVAAVRTDRLLMVTSDSVALAPLSDNWVWDYPLLTPPCPVKLKVGSRITDRSTLSLLHEALTLKTVSRDAWHDLSELYYSDGQMHAALTHPSMDILLGYGASELSWTAALNILKGKNPEELARYQTLDLRVPGKIIVAERMTAEEHIHG